MGSQLPKIFGRSSDTQSTRRLYQEFLMSLPGPDSFRQKIRQPRFQNEKTSHLPKHHKEGQYLQQHIGSHQLEDGYGAISEGKEHNNKSSQK